MKNLKKRVALSVVALTLAFLTGGSVLTIQAAEADRPVLDYSGLEEQIGIANGLEYYDYTKESWEVLSSTVEAGNQRLGDAGDQGKLDAAAQDIQYALESLVKMDYSSLQNALDIVYAKMEESPQLHDIWYRLDKAVDKARPLLVSGDQEAVNEMAATLNEIINELSAYNNTAAMPGVVVQEVEVEVPPDSDFCNMSQHRIWPILFAVSGALNLLMFAILGCIFVKKRNTIDNTPLVNYDIEDDITL